MFYICNMYLNAHSYFSLRYGTMSPEALVAHARQQGVKSLALTDINNTSAAYTFIRACEKEGIKPMVGIEFRRDRQLLFIGIAQNRRGFAQLNKFLTDASLDGLPLPDVAPEMPDTFIIYPGLVKPMALFRKNEFIGIRPEKVNALFRSPLLRYRDKLVVRHPVTFGTDGSTSSDAFRVHKLLRAIDLNTLVTKLQPQDMAQPTEVFRDEAFFAQAYQAYPFILENTQKIIDQCHISIEPGLHHNRQNFTGSKVDDHKLLSKLAFEGAKKRYTDSPEERIPRVIVQRIEKELKVIRELDFGAYFLITWDIIRYARGAGYHHVGRGSGANSIVAYCLEITDVDPVDLDLYFERFINPYRTSPPDFDIDFSWSERDDVVDYIFKRYGREHTALLATYSTFKSRSIIRELGKAFGLPKDEIDVLIDYPNQTENHHPYGVHIRRFGQLIEGFPNHLSIHAGGILITEKPITEFTALQMMPKGFPITHFDMYGAEKMGLHKFDVLSQRGLGHIRNTVDYIRINKGKYIDIHDIRSIKRDKNVAAQMRSGQALGCFYVESPAMRGLLTKLKCDTYLQLVAASSIIRPGVAKSGMMKAYIERHHAPNSFEYLHPVFKEHLAETYGIMVYQEDVIKIVHYFAGLDLNESDVLRRIMSGKKHSRDTFDRLRKKYYENCQERGYSKELADEVWRQIESFSGYSFSKAHSASYAVESMQSLYLKTYYPLEFMVAVINNFGGFYRTEYYFHEARMQGGTLHPPCVNHSLYLTTLYDTDIYVGFIHVQQLERQLAQNIVRERLQNGPYQNLEDFTNRIDISTTQLDILIRIGAFRFTEVGKYELMWQKNGVLPDGHLSGTGLLFESTAETFELPELQEAPHEQAMAEIELLGFPLCSPFELLDASAKKVVQARPFRVADFSEHIGRTVRILGYYVAQKRLRTSKGKLMSFGTWYDESGVFFDSVHFSPSLKRSPFRGKGIYWLEGKVVDEFGFLTLDVGRMERLGFNFPKV